MTDSLVDFPDIEFRHDFIKGFPEDSGERLLEWGNQIAEAQRDLTRSETLKAVGEWLEKCGVPEDKPCGVCSGSGWIPEPPEAYFNQRHCEYCKGTGKSIAKWQALVAALKEGRMPKGEKNGKRD